MTGKPEMTPTEVVKLWTEQLGRGEDQEFSFGCVMLEMPVGH